MADRDDRKWRRGLFSALLTFVLSLIFSCLSEFFLGRVTALILALLLLFVIILIGVLFDMVGFAAAAAEIGHLNARAANKLLGARQAVNLVKNADQVAIFCNDVMGDICATVSGAIGVTIVFRLATGSPGQRDPLFGVDLSTDRKPDKELPGHQAPSPGHRTDINRPFRKCLYTPWQEPSCHQLAGK
jgi:TM2 domain-containing membrane protein YozV